MTMYSLLFLTPLLCFLLHLLIGRRLSRLALPPGPSGIPILGALPLIGPAPHSSLAHLATLHGPIMYLKMGTCGVAVASTASAARTFLTTLDAQFANRPSVASGRDITYGGNDLLFANYGPRWKLLRKLSTIHFLGSSAIRGWASIRRDEVGLLLRSMLASSGDQPIVVSKVVLGTVANIIGRVMLSRRVVNDEGKDSGELKGMIADLLTAGGLFNIGDFVPAIAWMDLFGVQKRFKRVHMKFDALITKLLAEHECSVLERESYPDFIDLVIANQRDELGELLTYVNIKGLIFDMITAGTDAPTLVIEWALAEMISNPCILEKMQLEMDRVIGRERRLEELDIPNLSYLMAVCKETLRKHPPTPLGIPHFTFESCKVDGYYIPADTRLLVNIWAIGRDPNVWERPLEFTPERFLSGKGVELEPLGSDFELIPFGSGRRACAGKQAGLLMVQYILGSLVHSFNWKLPLEGMNLNMEEKFGITLPRAVPLVTLVTPRLVPACYH